MDLAYWSSATIGTSSALLVCLYGRRWWRWRRARQLAAAEDAEAEAADKAGQSYGDALALRTAITHVEGAIRALAPEKPQTPRFPMEDLINQPLEDAVVLEPEKWTRPYRLFANGEHDVDGEWHASPVRMGGQLSSPTAFRLDAMEYRLTPTYGPNATGAPDDAATIERERHALGNLHVQLRIGCRHYYEGPLWALPLDYRENPIFIPPQQAFCVEVSGLPNGAIQRRWKLQILLRGRLGREVTGPPQARGTRYGPSF